MTKKVIETVNGWYMENPKQKVELDDIIGLVKTDEPTNSVQLKKEAQLSICEKRVMELEKENEQLKQQREELFIRERDTKNDWRELRNENEQLKQQLDYADDLIHSHLSKHFIRQWINFKSGHKEYNDFWEEKLKKHNELER